MNTTLLSLSQYASLARTAVKTDPDDSVVIVPLRGGQPLPLIVASIHELPPVEVVKNLDSFDRALIFFFISPGQTIAERTDDIVLCRELGEGLGVDWDLVISWAGIRFAVCSDRTWIDEPETDLMSNDELDQLLVTFGGPIGDAKPRHLSANAVRTARTTWYANLNAMASDTGTIQPVPHGSLRAGSIRDTVIVWAIGKDGQDQYKPRAGFEPPTWKPDEERVRLTLSLLADHVATIDGGDALACAAYLGWWCGWTRFATYCCDRAQAGGVLTRLGYLVQNALLQEVRPPWIG